MEPCDKLARLQMSQCKGRHHCHAADEPQARPWLLLPTLPELKSVCPCLSLSCLIRHLQRLFSDVFLLSQALAFCLQQYLKYWLSRLVCEARLASASALLRPVSYCARCIRASPPMQFCMCGFKALCNFLEDAPSHHMSEH